MKTKIYIVSFTSYTESDNYLHTEQKTFANSLFAQDYYDKMCDNARENAADIYDNPADAAAAVSEQESRQDVNNRETTISREEGTEMGYKVIVRLEAVEIDIKTDSDEDEDTGEPEEKVKMGVLQVFFSDRDEYELAKTIYDSTGPSQFWAGDWNDEFRMIEFAEAGELDALEQALTADLESYGLTGYHFEGEEDWV